WGLSTTTSASRTGARHPAPSDPLRASALGREQRPWDVGLASIVIVATLLTHDHLAAVAGQEDVELAGDLPTRLKVFDLRQARVDAVGKLDLFQFDFDSGSFSFRRPIFLAAALDGVVGHDLDQDPLRVVVARVLLDHEPAEVQLLRGHAVDVGSQR